MQKQNYWIQFSEELKVTYDQQTQVHNSCTAYVFKIKNFQLFSEMKNKFAN